MRRLEPMTHLCRPLVCDMDQGFRMTVVTSPDTRSPTRSHPTIGRGLITLRGVSEIHLTGDDEFTAVDRVDR